MNNNEKITKAIWIIKSLKIIPGGLLAFSRLTYFLGKNIIHESVTSVQFIAKKTKPIQKII